MRILFVIDQFARSRNGTTMTARRSAKALREMGHTVEVLTGMGDEEQGVYETGIKRYPVLFRLTGAQGMYLAKNDENLLEEAIASADLVHCFLPFSLERKARRIAEAMGVATTAAFHLQPENITSTLLLARLSPLNEILYACFRRFYNRFEYVHCPSRMIEKQLMHRRYTAHTRVISNGVGERFRPMDVERPPRHKGKHIILMVGRLSREKRQDVLIDAIAQSPLEADIQLILAGSGPWEKRLRKKARKLTNPVEFAFFEQSDLIDVMNYADLYVHASDVEIEAIACIEAFACGLVPIISDSPKSATNQFAIDAVNRFKAGDPADLERKMRRLLKDEALREELSKRYIEYSAHFRLDKSMRALEAFFQSAYRAHEKSAA